MTAKRFIIENERTVCDDFYGKCFVCSWKSDAEEMCRLLNELYEENMQLKSEYKVLHTQYHDLKKFVENNFNEYLTQEKLNRQIIKLSEENEQLKQQLFETSKELLWATSDEVDRALYYEDEVEELRKEIFE